MGYSTVSNFKPLVFRTKFSPVTYDGNLLSELRRNAPVHQLWPEGKIRQYQQHTQTGKEFSVANLK